MMSPSSEDQAISTVCSRHFHQALWLPETASHPKLRISYATTTNFDNASLPAILFISPLFSTRWFALHFDKLARDCGVRVVCVDRPGFGGSTPVALDIRMSVWLETVPALLQHLRVKHVALLTHSAGTIYTLNTLLHFRSLLDPKTPYVAFFAPFVASKHSGATLATIGSKLPTGVLDSYASLAALINNKIMPSAGWSGGVLSSVAALLSFSTATDTPTAEAATSTTPKERHGFDDDTAQLIDKLASKWQFAENIKGLNEEMKNCLQKNGSADWGAAADYASCIREIAANEAALASADPDAAKLSVDAFFAGSDVIIAKRGQEYFEQCWQGDEVKDNVDFTTSTFEKANHDSVLVDQKTGALRNAFQKLVDPSKTRGRRDE